MPTVTAVHCNSAHTFSKPALTSIRLIAGLGVEGDAHMGITVQHLSRVAQDPTQPNLRQVHLLHAELFDELAHAGFSVHPGDMGENITTRGIDLLALPTGALLTLGSQAVVELTGLRNPCAQIDRFQPGLLPAVLGRSADGTLIRKAGIMAIVLVSGEIKPGDPIQVTLPPQPHIPLKPV